MLKNLANAALFQLGWFACVLGGNSLWLLVAVGAIVAHLLWISRSWDEVRLIVAVCVIGTLVDSALLYAGVFEFKDAAGVIPLWLIVLWALLATTLRHCLAWTAKPLWRAALLGAIGGAMSYYAGQRLGAVAFGFGLWPTLAMLSAIWAGLFAVLQGLAGRTKRP